MITCPNCDGDGGWEVVDPPTGGKWGDPTPGGHRVECLICCGAGLVAGIPPSITIDDLPPPTGNIAADERERQELEEACYHTCSDDECQFACGNGGRCPLEAF